MSSFSYAQYIDHTLLRATATKKEIEQLCNEAVEHSFFSVCVNPTWLPLCKNLLLGSDVKLCTAVGFPLGAHLAKSKAQETELCLKAGAQEIDCVINVGALKSDQLSVVQEELQHIVSLCQSKALVKVIVESGVLSAHELSAAIRLVNESQAEFIKTSTGFANVGATEEAVLMMKKEGRPGLKIKASGGIRSSMDFKKFLHLGVDRIGASASVAILQALTEEK